MAWAMRRKSPSVAAGVRCRSGTEPDVPDLDRALGRLDRQQRGHTLRAATGVRTDGEEERILTHGLRLQMGAERVLGSERSIRQVGPYAFSGLITATRRVEIGEVGGDVERLDAGPLPLMHAPLRPWSRLMDRRVAPSTAVLNASARRAWSTRLLFRRLLSGFKLEPESNRSPACQTAPARRCRQP